MIYIHEPVMGEFDKVIKNIFATEYVYNNIKYACQKTVYGV